MRVRWGDDGCGYDMDRAASIISSAEGPSGKNAEYLVNLRKFLISLGLVDHHVEELYKRVEQKGIAQPTKTALQNNDSGLSR